MPYDTARSRRDRLGLRGETVFLASRSSKIGGSSPGGRSLCTQAPGRPDVNADLLHEQIALLAEKGVRLPAVPEEALAAAIQPASRAGSTLLHRGRSYHSRYDPIKEARRLAGEIEIEREDQLVCFFGAGLGYSLRLFRDLHSNPCVWFEPDPLVLGAALSVSDFRPELGDGSLIVVPRRPVEESLHEIFRGRGNRQIVFVSHRGSMTASDEYRRIQTICENFLNKKDVNLATMARFDRDWARNLIANFYALARARPVAALFDAYAGRTALVCGAGPSLSDDLPAIVRHRSRYVLIAVDTALAVLTGAGIDPDIVVSVDPQPVNRYYLEGYAGRARFVVDPTTSYLSLRMIAPDRLYYTASPFALAKWFFEFLDGEPGEIAFGGSVSTNAYDLAIKLGCRTVLMAGMDLSFTGGLAHVRGAVLEERLNYRESRLFRRELHNYRQLSALPVRYLPGLDGQPVPTNDKLVIFFRWLDNRIRLDRADGLAVHNCSARGARLAGLERTSLDDWAAEAGTDRSPAAPAGETPAAFRIDEFYASVDARIAELAELEPLLASGRELSAAILDRALQGPRDREYAQMLARMDELDAEVRAKTALSNFIGEAIQRVIFQITEDFGNLLEDADRADEHRETARKSQLLYEGLLTACADHRRWLTHAARVHRLNA